MKEIDILEKLLNEKNTIVEHKDEEIQKLNNTIFNNEKLNKLISENKKNIDSKNNEISKLKNRLLELENENEK